MSLLHIQQAHKRDASGRFPSVNAMAADLLLQTSRDLVAAKAQLTVEEIRELVFDRLGALQRHAHEQEGPRVCANCYVWFSRSKKSPPGERAPCRSAQPCQEPS